MPKGRHRRHRQARALKQRPEVAPHLAALCDECGRSTDSHAVWCLAEADLGDVDDPGSDAAGDADPTGR